MELFRSLRIKTGNHILRKKALKIRRKRKFLNLAEAKSIGVLWDIHNPEDITSISDFILQMNERGIKVEVMGFYNGKELPDKLTALRYLNCLKREDYSFWYKPKTQEADIFIATTHDLLIEICFRDTLPLRYISTISGANFKVGPAFNGDENRQHLDLLIDAGDKPIVREYLKQVVLYLEMINKRDTD